jgi:hypothetical protein
MPSKNKERRNYNINKDREKEIKQELGKETKKRGLDVRKSGSVGQINK